MNKTTKQEGFFPMEHTGKRALVLAGGGAKGSYQIGVWRALQELDWTPDIITGASVGTLNGCLFTMGKIQEAEDLWRSLEIHDVLEVPATLKPEELRAFFLDIIRSGGLNVEPLAEMIDRLIDENAVRTSPIHFGHDDPTMIRMLEDLTGVNARTIPLDDPDTMSIFTSSKVLGFENDDLLGPTGAVAIPEFNTRFTRQMLIDTQPKDFNTLVRLSGFSHGTDVWLGNARELIVSGTASVLETVGCRDDIMLYLISMGLDPKMSFKIMEAVRKGKVKKGGFQDGWVEAMQEHDVPEWYIESLAKIGYLFPKAHAVAYVMMAFRIAWFKVHEPLAFYATFFTVRAKAFDAEYCCAGLDAVKRKIREIENNKDASAVEQDLMTTLEVCYEFYRRGFHFDTIDIYRSDATKFTVTEGGLLPPFISVHGLGEAAALDTVEKRRGKEFISVEEFSMCCNKLSKTHIEQLRALGAFAGMADTSQLTLFG